MKHFFIIVIFLFVTGSASGQSINVQQVFSDSVSVRGLSVVDDQVAWIGASKGTVAVTKDGGKNWRKVVVPGHERSDFRSVYAFDSKKAVIANAGSPANILLTRDGGATWRIVYSNDHADAFIDGVDFWNSKEGVMYGDPIDGKMVLLRTSDGGETWEMLPDEGRPQLSTGEASFAASGTGVRCLPNDKIYVVSGGVKSRLFYSSNKGKTWTVSETPIIQGEQGTGIFSFAILNRNAVGERSDSERIIIVGGDFQKPQAADKHIFYSDDGGKSWIKPAKSTGGYRECVEEIDRTLYATGPYGTDVSDDRGVTWNEFSKEGFHVVRKARSGSLVIFAGGKGKVGLFK